MHPIERSFFVKLARTDVIDSPLRSASRRDLLVRVFFGGLDVFGGGDSVEDQFSLHVFDRRGRVGVPRMATQSTFTARGSTPCAASVRRRAARRISI